MNDKNNFIPRNGASLFYPTDPEKGFQGGGKQSRRKFLKRTGGATAGAFVAWNLTTKQARAGLGDGNCGHSDHGEHNDNIDSELAGIFDDYFRPANPGYDPHKALEDSFADLAERYTENSQGGSTVEPEAFLLDWGERFLKKSWDQFEDNGFNDQFRENFWKNHPRSEGTALLLLGGAAALGGFGYYLNNHDPSLDLHVPIPLLKKRWECGDGYWELELKGELGLQFDGDLLDPELDSWGGELKLSYYW